MTEPLIIQGDARKLDLPDASVDLIVTSPPYWSLRSYTDGGEHYADQIGAEPTPAAYVDSLIECTRDWMRVLKPTGSIWVNLGDKYGPDKSLVGLPWRYALRCIDELGLILRAEVIWSKPNGLPESVTDRVRRSHETWFHFTVAPRYYAAVDAIREPYDGDRALSRRVKLTGMGAEGNKQPATQWTAENPLGKLPGSVWTIATQPLRVPAELGVDHFAAFPMEWPRRIIAGWSPSGICTACGQGRRPVVHTPSPTGIVKRANATNTDAPRGLGATSGLVLSGGPHQRWRAENPAVITGETCGCPDTAAPTRPAVVLDPFGGTGTTALVADVLGRHGISVDMSADYCRVARWRVADPKQRERAARGPAPARASPRPDPLVTDQLTLFNPPAPPPR